MEYTTFQMSNEQIKEFAIYIVADIEDYVKNHKKEYEVFLHTIENLDDE